MKPTRRRALQLAAAGAGCASSARARAFPGSLQAVARRRGLSFGSAVAANAGGGIDNPTYAELAATQCGVVVAESEMKWRELQPTPGAYRFDPADRIVTWARSRGLEVRGHNLFWNLPERLPDWVNAYDLGARPASAAEKLLVDHVTTVCRHFGAVPTSWDVVNEAIDPATGAMRQTVFTRALGDRAVDIAFHAAREALPRTRLVYNDYMSWEVGNEAHRAGVLRLLERLKRDGVPVDALGLQSHIGGDPQASTTPGRPQPPAWRAFLQEATGLGLGLLVTEFDVNGRMLQGSVGQRDAAMAAYARDYLDLTLSFPQVSDVLCWGLVDRFSWLQRLWPRPDGLAKRPLPYDDAYAPKPMRAAIAAALAAAPRRSRGTFG